MRDVWAGLSSLGTMRTGLEPLLNSPLLSWSICCVVFNFFLYQFLRNFVPSFDHKKSEWGTEGKTIMDK